ncbi:MAG: hypothetical protein ACI867_001547 [Glaciecola sp.]|jgi:hypothetical protein
MPKSKHRRNNKNRPRKNSVKHTPVKNPTPSPEWVPRVGVGLIAVGIVVILLGYLPGVSDLIASWPVFHQNWSLVGGFALLAGGFGFLTRWQ